MRTAVDAAFVGRERLFNRRFLQVCSHYLVEPAACTPASGWEKGQVENQVSVVRERSFKPRLRFEGFAELNAWLLGCCVSYARAHPHPERRDSTVWEMFEAERPSLVPYAGPFDGLSRHREAIPRSDVSEADRGGVGVQDLSGTPCVCAGLVQFDENKCSVVSQAVGRPVEVHAYADRIRVRQDGGVVADMLGGPETEYSRQG